jgi:hypothetical protein
MLEPQFNSSWCITHLRKQKTGAENVVEAKEEGVQGEGHWGQSHHSG